MTVEERFPEVRSLIALGKERGYLLYDEIFQNLPEELTGASEDLDEVFALADCIAVMHHGRLTPALPVADWTLAAIGLAMAGVAASSELADAV